MRPAFWVHEPLNLLTNETLSLGYEFCIFYMKGKFHLNEKIDDRMKRFCFISEITIAELLYGATCSNRKDKILKEVESFVSQFTILPIYDSLLTFAELKNTLRSQGNLIDDFDLLIGASAVANDLILVTENMKHLERVPRLKIENWINRALD